MEQPVTRRAGLFGALFSMLAGRAWPENELKLRPTPPWHQGTRSRPRQSGNAQWRKEHPGCSLDMKRYAKRYRNPGTLRAKHPFSAKRK